MNEQRVNVFLQGVMNYLDHIPNIDTKIGTPYLIDNEKPVSYDITGVITVSGALSGCVYFTAPRIFLTHLLTLQGEKNLSKENLLDLSGEIANTISGNARATFGEDFIISVPVVIEGAVDSLHLPSGNRSISIPISWRSYTPLLVVNLEWPKN